MRLSSPALNRRMLLVSAASFGALGPSGAAHAAGTPATAAAIRGFITSQNGDRLTVLDLDAMRVVGDLAVPGHPAGIALSPARPGGGSGKRLAYVSAPDAKDVVVIDSESLGIIRRVRVGEGPLGIASLPDGRVCVADWYEHKLYVLAPGGEAIAGTVEVGLSPSGVAVTPDGRLILSADRDSDQVSISDAGTLKRVAVVPVGTRPFGISIDGSGAFAFTANVGSDDVSVIEIAAAKVIGTAKVGRRPYAVAVAGNRLFVTDQYGGTVSVVGMGSLRKVGAIEVGDHPEGIAADAAGFVYVACWLDNVVMKIDARTLAVVGKVAVPDGPRAFGLFIG